MLTDAQRAAVFDAVKPCWREPADTPAGEAVTLLIPVNGGDMVVDATVVPEDVARVDTSPLRGFARSALHAVTDPRCSRLSIPDRRISQPWLFRLRFTG